MQRRPVRLACLAAAVGLLGGCVTVPPRDRGSVAADLADRTGFDLGPPPSLCARWLPPGVTVDDGLTEDEAVALALWNNAAFQEALVDLGLARADVVTAGLLPNPELWLLFPVGVKQLEYALEFPLEALWLRPKRLDAARRESERVAEALAQTGLNLVRDVRWAYADALLARDRLAVAREAERLR